MSFTLPESATALVEGTAFVLALGYVLLSIRQDVRAWPLMIASSAAYAVLFASARLYGQVLLQGAFIAIAAWGWWQWRCGRKDAQPLAVTALAPSGRITLAGGWAIAAIVGALLLARLSDAATPWLDAFTTTGSLAGQVLTARKYVEAWPVWLLVNGVSVAMFAQQQLWLTALLYALFVALSVAGWRAWRRAAAAA